MDNFLIFFLCLIFSISVCMYLISNYSKHNYGIVTIMFTILCILAIILIKWWALLWIPLMYFLGYDLITSYFLACETRNSMQEDFKKEQEEVSKRLYELDKEIENNKEK